MADLNYHHLRYFREVAREGNLTRAAERLNLSQSALSTQIKTLEERLGQPLFDRVGRTLVLTEVGRITLDHADRIFETGDQLMATLRRSGAQTAPLRVGALSTLSRNFQMRFLRPMLADPDATVILRSGDTDALLADLRALALDVVLTTEAPQGEYSAGFLTHPLTETPVGLHGRPERMAHADLETLLASEPLILPKESAIRTGFETLVARLKVRPRVVADVDDMAMVRLLAREGVGIALAPAVVLADEITSGRIVSAPFELGIVERFMAVTFKRTYPHPALEGLIANRLGD